MRLNEADHADIAGLIIGLPVLIIVAVTTLVMLDKAKEQHQQAGLHQPTQPEQCYELPGSPELVTLQNMTFCAH